jgi:hypothetical protein
VPAPHIPPAKSNDYSSFRTLLRGICPGSRPCIPFCNILRFNREKLLAHRPTSKLGITPCRLYANAYNNSALTSVSAPPPPSSPNLRPWWYWPIYHCQVEWWYRFRGIRNFRLYLTELYIKIVTVTKLQCFHRVPDLRISLSSGNYPSYMICTQLVPTMYYDPWYQRYPDSLVISNLDWLCSAGNL